MNRSTNAETIGGGPTVGCMALFDQFPAERAIFRVVECLHPIAASGNWTPATGREHVLYSNILFGDTQLPTLLYTIIDNSTSVLLDFDEDQVVSVARRTGLTIAELLAPYIGVLESVAEVHGIAVGFEISPPTGLDDASLRDAGIALFFKRTPDNSSWSRSDLLPLIGHRL